MFRQKTFTISFLAVVLCMGTVHGAVAQDFKRQYKNAKDFFMEGKYNLAMEAFKPLISYDKNNPYSEYASFYYAQSAYRQRFFAVAKDMLLSIKKLYPEWDQMNEVNYWLAKIYFEQREYFQGMHMLQQVRQEDFIEVQEIGKIKRFYLSQIADPEVLRMMWEEYPQDAEVGTRLATAISRQPFLQQDRALLDAVISHFGLPRDQFSAASQAQLVFKDKYNVAVVFPFLTSTLDPSPAKKQNQLVLDLYEGMRMAADTLNKTGVPINLLAYDTERNPEALKKLLEADELKNADLIVGPIFREEFKPVQQISESRQINMISPVSNNSEFTGQNPFALLFQPSLETLGSKSADMLAKHTRNKKCMVLYGDTPKDSIMAANFIKQAGTVGLNVVWSEEFRKETAARIISILATPTEFDEYKNPIQFKMKIDSIGSIFVASDNPLIYTKVISSVETRGDSVVIVGSESWLDNPSVDLGKYEKLHMVIAAPNYTPYNSPAFIDFRKRFIKTHGAYPPDYMNYSKIGFECMMFIGHALSKYGVYFQDSLLKDGLLPVYLTKGYHLSPHRDNLQVPFVYFRNGELMSID